MPHTLGVAENTSTQKPKETSLGNATEKGAMRFLGRRLEKSSSNSKLTNATDKEEAKLKAGKNVLLLVITMDFLFPFKILYSFKKKQKEARMIHYLSEIQSPIKGSQNITAKLHIEKVKRIKDLVE